MELLLPTADEVTKIRNGNVATISKYYFANIDYLKRYVTSFCKRINDFNDKEDYLQEIFVNFQKLSFDNGRFFGRDCFKVMCAYHYGNQRKYEQKKDGKTKGEETILDSPVKGLEKEGTTLGDTIPVEDVYFADDVPDISEELFGFLSSFLAKEQSRVFAQFYWTGQTYNEVAETLGKNPRTVKRTREQCFVKLRKVKGLIQDFLQKIGYTESAYI